MLFNQSFQKHPHADVIHAYADGAKVQFRAHKDDDWLDILTPHFEPKFQYRIKPEPKPDIVSTAVLDFYGSHKRPVVRVSWSGEHRQGNLSLPDSAILKFSFDGETGKIKNVELVQQQDEE